MLTARQAVQERVTQFCLALAHTQLQCVRETALESDVPTLRQPIITAIRKTSIGLKIMQENKLVDKQCQAFAA